MRPYLIFFIVFGIHTLLSCGGSKSASVPGEKNLVGKLRKYGKNPGDQALGRELQQLYAESLKEHDARLSAYKSAAGTDRYDKMINEYRNMQLLSDVIRQNQAYDLLKPENYLKAIEDTKAEAAAFWYQEGENWLDKGDRESNRKAYDAFRKSEKYVPGYKNVAALKKEAFDASIVNVIFLPLESDQFLFPGWNNNNYTHNIVENLVRDLGGSSTSQTVPARLYTERDARFRNIRPDWLVNFMLRNTNVPNPVSRQYTRSVSKNIKTGVDTAGRPVYQTVTANLNITSRTLRTTGNLEYYVTEWQSREVRARDFISLQYELAEETATYNGDSRALGPEDWELVNRSPNRPPGRADFTEEMLRRAYPELRNRLRRELEW